MLNPNEVGGRLRELREKRDLSLRALAQKSGVAVSFLSKVEAGRGSPTLATLLKILEALAITVPEFFAAPAARAEEILVVRRADMQVLDDGDKSWRYLFPDAPDIKAIMTYEEYLPQTRHIEQEQHPADTCGVVLEGTLTLEVTGSPPLRVDAGDSFYIRAGVCHTAANREAKRLCLVVTALPLPLPGRRRRRSAAP